MKYYNTPKSAKVEVATKKGSETSPQRLQIVFRESRWERGTYILFK